MAIREQLAGRSAAERAAIKAAEIAKIDFRGRFAKLFGGEEHEIDILGIRRVESKGRPAVEIAARAFRNGRPVGFGKDGRVEIERFRIFNPPLLVDDPAGDLVQQFTNDDGITRTRRLREDATEALKQTLVQIVRAIGQSGDRIVRGRVGNTTSTFFPDASPESTSVDGRASRQASETQAAIIAGAGTHSQDSAPGPTFEECVRLRANSYPTCDRMSRGFFLFDTSALPDTDTIDSAVLSLYIYGQTNSGGWASTYSFYDATPASNTAIVASDYANVGSTALSASVAAGSISIDAYNDWALNSSGLAAIAPTGVSKFAIRSNHDAGAVDPGGSGELLLNCHYADTTGTSTDPMLVVEHSAGGGETHDGAAGDTSETASASAAGAKSGAGDATSTVLSHDAGAGTKSSSEGGSAEIPAAAASAAGTKGAAAGSSSTLSTVTSSASGFKSAIASATNTIGIAAGAPSGEKSTAGTAHEFHQAAHSEAAAPGVQAESGTGNDHHASAVDNASGARSATGSAGERSLSIDSSGGAPGKTGGAGGRADGLASSATGTKGAHGSASEYSAIDDAADPGSKAAAGAAADLLVLIEAATAFKHAFGSAHDSVQSAISFATKALPYSRFYVTDRSSSRYSVTDRSSSRYKVVLK